MSWTPPPLETDRLNLRAQPTPQQAGEQGASPLSSRNPGLPSNWQVIHKNLGRVIGFVGFIRWERERRCAEIGFWLERAHRGQGLMAEALRPVLAFGFNQMGLDRIEALCQPSNPASERVLSRIGMQREGTVRGRLHAKAEPEDFHLYAVTRADWLRTG